MSHVDAGDSVEPKESKETKRLECGFYTLLDGIRRFQNFQYEMPITQQQVSAFLTKCGHVASYVDVYGVELVVDRVDGLTQFVSLCRAKAEVFN